MKKYTIKSTSSEGVYYLVNGWNKCKTFWFNEKSVMEDKENGTYLLMIKGEGDMHFECRVDILDDQFDLPFVDIHAGGKVYHVDFDAE